MRSAATGRVTEGKILLNGQDITDQGVRERIDLGIGYVPSDRQRYGLIMSMKLTENMFLKSSFDDTWVKRGLVDKKKLDAYTDEKIRVYDVKATGPARGGQEPLRRQPAEGHPGARGGSWERGHPL